MDMNTNIENTIKTYRKINNFDFDVNLYPLMNAVLNEMKKRKVAFLPKQVVRNIIKPLVRNESELRAGLVLGQNLGLGRK